MKLRQKMLVLILLPVVLLTGISSYYAYHTAKVLLQNQIYRTDQFKSANYSSMINDRLMKYETAVKSLASIVALSSDANTDYRALAVAAAKGDPDFLNISIAFEDKRFYNSDGSTPPPGYDATTREWYKVGLAGDGVKAQYSEPYTGVNTSDLMVTIGTPIRKDGRAIGVVAMDVDLKKLLSVISEMKTGETGYVFVVDGDGNFLSHPQYKFTEKLQEIRNGEMAEFFNRITKEDYFTTTFNFDGKERLYSARNIGNTPWSLCTSMETGELFASVNGMAQALGASAFVTLLILVAMILYVIKDINSILASMKAFTEELAGGDFRDKPRRVTRKDEFGEITDALASMRTNLRLLIEKIRLAADQLAASSEELTASADQSAQASNQVAQSITSVAEGAGEQRRSVDDANKNIQTMSKLIGGMARDIGEVAAGTQMTAARAGDGNESVNKAIVQMKSIQDTVGASAVVVQELGKRSNEIGEIVNTIASIAGQTNLLALNAAIEAARAGEHGKGFAVVAEEVRKLAEQSQSASGHIAELIREIQDKTEKAVAAMTEGTKEVASGNEAVKATGEIFREIKTMITEASAYIQQLQSGMHTIEGSNQKVVDIAQTIHTISEKAADEAQNVSAATEEQAASMTEMATASQSLAKLALTLQDTVNQFKI